ncbi:hypothetical protein D3C79_885910 [compost metagenome]
MEQDRVVTLAGAALFHGLLPGQTVEARLVGVIGHCGAGEHQVAGPGGDGTCIRGGRAWADALALAAVVDAQAITAARGVLQQVGADGHGEGLGGFGGFGAGLTLEDTSDILFAVQAGDQLVLE